MPKEKQRAIISLSFPSIEDAEKKAPIIAGIARFGKREADARVEKFTDDEGNEEIRITCNSNHY